MKKIIFCVLALMCASVLPSPAQANHNFEVSKNLDIFNSLYKALDEYYVDTLQADKVITDAIDYLLDGLDPYTEYFPESHSKDLQTLTTGKYAGIGALIHYYKDRDRCIIDEPYEGMPAAKAGLRAGDVIMSIDGKDLGVKGKMEAEDYSSMVSDHLRGDPGTTATIVVSRPGTKDPLTFAVVRESVTLPSVPYYDMVTDSIGYIYLKSFTRGCSDEVLRALRALKGRGARSLILDLRGNGGGLAAEAVNIVNLFVPKGQLILQMKGKVKASNATYMTRKDPEDLHIPLIVLVDGGSASASEITCGSLQDLDRAVIVGTRTYGKGLVQQPRDLPFGAMLKLTTSKYYIPSGRCIQALDYSNRNAMGEAYRTPDSLTHVFHTAAGRSVRDGGGITPDVVCHLDSLPNLLAYLRVSDRMFDYVTDYRNHHETLSSPATFHISDADYDHFIDFMEKSDFTYDRQSQKELQRLKSLVAFEGYGDVAAPELASLEKKLSHNLRSDLTIWNRQVKQMLDMEIVKRYSYQRGSLQNQLKDDTFLPKAISLLRHPEEYMKILK